MAVLSPTERTEWRLWRPPSAPNGRPGSSLRSASGIVETMSSPVSQVWYVSYGSNMCRDRLACYLAGGTPRGASRCYVGARDPRMPAEDVGVLLPGSIYFAGRSATWGGGVAYYDHDRPGPTPARAYRVTAAQFADVAAQEMHRVPEPGGPLEKVVMGGLESGRHEAGPGRYETLVQVGRRDGVPMLTFTAPHGYAGIGHTPPSAAYLRMLTEGLRDAHGWDEKQIAAYFERVGAPAQAA